MDCQAEIKRCQASFVTQVLESIDRIKRFPLDRIRKEADAIQDPQKREVARMAASMLEGHTVLKNGWFAKQKRSYP